MIHSGVTLSIIEPVKSQYILRISLHFIYDRKKKKCFAYMN